MYPYIVCTCGYPLGDIYTIFDIMRRAKYIQAYGEFYNEIDPSILAITESIQVTLEDVFDQLNIDLICCRTRLLTQVTFDSIY